MSSTTLEQQPQKDTIQKQKETVETEVLVKPITWREIFPNFLASGVILAGILSEYYLGNFFFIVWIPYVIFPILDFLLPVDHYNEPEERVRLLEKDKRYLIPLYLPWAMDIAYLVYILNGISQGTIEGTTKNLIYYAICAAQIGALNAVIGHELIHRRNIVHKICGTISYAKMIYSHFFI